MIEKHTPTSTESLLRSRSLLAVLVAIAMFAFAGIARANLLANPGFETQGSGATDAAVWAEAANGHTAERSSSIAHGGDWSMYFNVGPVNNNTGANNANVTQSLIPVGPVAGELVQFSGWALNPSVDPMVGTTERVELRIWWYTASNSLISFITSTILDANDATDTWTYGSVIGVAPAGTEKVTAQIIFRTDPTNQTTGSAYVDALRLTVIPEPASAAMLSLVGTALLRRRRR